MIERRDSIVKNCCPKRTIHGCAFLFSVASTFAFAQRLPAQSPPVDMEIQLTSGRIIRATILDITNDEVLISTDKAKEILSFDDINQIRLDPVPPAAFRADFLVLLQDATKLYLDQISMSKNEVRLELVGGSSAKCKLRDVAWLRRKPVESDAELENRWQHLLEEDFSSDAIVVDQDGVLESIEGVIGDVKDNKVSFTIGDRTANVALEKVFALVYYRPSAQNSFSPICNATLRSGSSLAVEELGWSTNQVALRTPTGLELFVPVAEIATIDFAVGRELFLDMLKPASNQWEPLIANAATVDLLRQLNIAKINKSFSDGPLELANIQNRGGSSAERSQQFEHGFAIRGGGKLAFVLDDSYRVLKGLVGFAPQANRQGEVMLTVRVDGRVALQKQLTNDRTSQPLELDIDISGAQRLVFQVDYCDGRSIGDQIHMVNLRVAK